MIRILFLINTLGGGGAEKVLVNLVNNMDKEKFDITVETMFDDGVNAEQLNSDIKYISKKAFCPRGIAQIYRFLSSEYLYKKFIGNEKYDILVAYMHGAPVKVIAGCSNKSTKKIAWLHNGKPETGTFFKFWFNEKNAFEAYESMDSIVGVSQEVSDAFARYTKLNKKIVTVYNTNDVNRINKLASEKSELDNKYINIVSVGRISHEKGYLRLFDVCKRLKEKFENIRVYIVGSGEEQEKFKNLIMTNNAENWFIMQGFQSNPYKYVAKADLFVCSSYEEGLSTAVTEAVILGIPVVSTDVSGAKEILGKNNEYGIVTQNSEQGLYDGLKTMLESKQLRDYYKNKATERAEFFDTKNTVSQAEKLFREVIKQ